MKGAITVTDAWPVRNTGDHFRIDLEKPVQIYGEEYKYVWIKVMLYSNEDYSGAQYREEMKRLGKE